MGYSQQPQCNRALISVGYQLLYGSADSFFGVFFSYASDTEEFLYCCCKLQAMMQPGVLYTGRSIDWWRCLFERCSIGGETFFNSQLVFAACDWFQKWQFGLKIQNCLMLIPTDNIKIPSLSITSCSALLQCSCCRPKPWPLHPLSHHINLYASIGDY